MIKKKFGKTLAAIGFATMLMMPFESNDKTALAADAAVKNVAAGSTWVVDEYNESDRLDSRQMEQSLKPPKAIAHNHDG